MKRTPVLTLLLLLFIMNKATAQTMQTARLAIHSYTAKAGKKARKKGKYTMDQFIGRWQETERMKSDTKEKVAIADTMYIHFYVGDTTETKQGNTLVLKGTSALYTFNDDYITTSADDFRIVSVSPDVIVLDDMFGYTHSFSRKTTLFSYEIVTPPPVAPPDIDDNKVDLSPSSLIKNWFAYRRGAKPGFVKAEMPVLRYLRISKQLSENSYSGNVEFARNGTAYVQTCTLVFAGRMLSIDTEGSAWNVEVYKADGKEMIIGKKGELVYYFMNQDH